jgi:hypothetical protein
MEDIEKSEQVDLAIVLGYIAVKDLNTLDKKVAVLTQLGFTNKDMARICGTTDNVIRAIKSKIRKKGKDLAITTSTTQDTN